MADFPGSGGSTTMLATASLGCSQHTPWSSPTAGGTWPAANRAIFVAFLVEEPVTVTQMAILPTVQSGNFDIGIYDEGRNRMVSSGSTAVGAAAALQLIDVTDTLLNPGVYFFALCIDNTTAAVYRTANGSAPSYSPFGIQQQSLGSVTLPSTATFSTPASVYLPMIQALTMSTVI